jgi:hypothetical protein
MNNPVDPSKSRVVREKGQSTSRVTSTSGRESRTFVLAANAVGRRTPLLIIFKGKNIVCMKKFMTVSFSLVSLK